MASTKAKNDNIRVLIVTEILLMADAIDALISNCGRIRVIGWAATAKEAMAKVSNGDVVLISAALPGNGTFELVRTIATEYPEVKNLVIGLPIPPSIVLFWLEIGASGYVLQTEPGQLLLETIQAVYDNHSTASLEVAKAKGRHK